jgi:hypothetical protein
MYSFWQKLPSDRLRLSNCYSYAVDRFTGGWAMPGLGGGMGEPSPASMNCAELSKRVIADGAAPATKADAVSGPVPAVGHYIALMVRPQSSCDFAHCGPDFHFARRDAGGRWSHKVGEAPATDRDAAGQPITDPQAAQFAGGYTEFCGFFKVDPAHLRAASQPGSDRVSASLQRWRDAGLDVQITPLPYDRATDFTSEADRAKERARMQQLQQGPEAQRGRRLLRGA